MKTLLRALILLLIVLWLGGVMFFPVVAATAFSSLPDTHAAGTVVGKCLRILHYEGLFAGTLLIILLLAAQRVRAYARNVALPILLALVMLGLTAFSQFWIIPRMEGYRMAAGGSIGAVAADDPNRVEFNRLHVTSEHLEQGVLIAGLVLVVLLAANRTGETI
jgi:uncharacterized protein DUF4149